MRLSHEEATALGLTKLLPPGDPWRDGAPVTTEEPSAPKRSKYGNSKTSYGGVIYDSKGEAGHARKLDLDQAAGLIRCWFRQITVRLGVPENVMRVDFLVVGPAGCWFDEFKGKDTPKFCRDKKLWAKYGPLPLRVIRRGKVVEVIEPQEQSPCSSG